MKTRILALVMALMMVLGLVPATAEEELPFVTLEWYVAEDSMPDNQQVFDALNAYFKEKLNCHVNFHFTAYSEYSQKVGTMHMRGQPLDIVNVNSALPYAEWVKKGAFLPMDEYLTDELKATYEMIPEGLWSAMVIDGHTYAVPSYKDSVDIRTVQINKSMFDELGMEIPASVRTGQDMVPLMREAYAKRNELHPEMADRPITRGYWDLDTWAPSEKINEFLAMNVPTYENYEGMGSGEIVFNRYMTAEYRNMCKTVAALVDEGVLMFDVFNFDVDRIYSKDGSYLYDGYGNGWVYCAPDQYGDGFEAALIPYEKNIATTNYLHSAAEAIASTCKDPERAAMVLELINMDPYVATTLRFGVEGVHWTETENGQIHFIGTNENRKGHYYWYGAQFGALVNAKMPENQPENFIELLLAANERAVTDTNLGFIFDPTPVQNEVAAVGAVVEEFKTNLQFGYIPSDEVDAEIDAFIAKMQANGSDKVVAEAQRQLTEWRAANGKSVAE